MNFLTLPEARNVDLNIGDGFPLYKAVKHRHLDLIKLLLEDERVDPMAKNGRALRTAIEQADMDIIELFHQRSGEIAIKLTMASVKDAIRNAEGDFFQRFLQLPGIDNRSYGLILMKAVKKQREDIVRLLIPYKDTLKENYIIDAAYIAIRKDYYSILQLLMQSFLPKEKDMGELLAVAVGENRMEHLRYLLTLTDRDPNGKDCPALQIAIDRNMHEVAKTILQHPRTRIPQMVLVSWFECYDFSHRGNLLELILANVRLANISKISRSEIAKSDVENEILEPFLHKLPASFQSQIIHNMISSGRLTPENIFFTLHDAEKCIEDEYQKGSDECVIS
jgi:hypothetical protein